VYYTPVTSKFMENLVLLNAALVVLVPNKPLSHKQCAIASADTDSTDITNYHITAINFWLLLWANGHIIIVL
jgi:hypothetical protein